MPLHTCVQYIYVYANLIVLLLLFLAHICLTHILIACVYTRLSSFIAPPPWTHAQGDLDGALQHFNQAIELQQLAGVSDSLDTAACLINLGNVFSRLGDHEQALEQYRRAIEIQERLPHSGPDRAAAHQNCGTYVHPARARVSSVCAPHSRTHHHKGIRNSFAHYRHGHD